MSHQKGDTCLIQIAQALFEGVARKMDFVARYGGEEFAYILPNTNLDSAVAIAEKLRLSIMAQQIPHAYSSVSNFVTISSGVAAIIPDRNSSCNILIKAADDALYRAKENGRNKISI